MAKVRVSGILGEEKWTKERIAAFDQTARPGLGQKKSTTRVELPKDRNPAAPHNNPVADVSALLPASLGGRRVSLHGAVVTADGDLVK